MSQIILQSAAPTERKGRYPKHPFRVDDVPYSIQPIMIAPVLPGETLQNLYFESRVVTQSIKNPLIGWKKEYIFFYVRITDLLIDAIRDMFVDPANTDLLATYGIASNQQYSYTAKGGINYMERCLQRVVEHWFRDDGDAWNSTLTTAGVPMAYIKDNFWMDTLTDKDAMPEGAAISGATDAGDLDRLMDAFEQLRALGIANMTYEDWLRSNGIAIPSKDEGKPEKLAHFSDFQYPSNTVDPATGVPSSAVSWVFKNSARDPKFFKEPGFVIGVTVTRPKVYYSGLAGGLASFMSRAWDWMPNYLHSMPETSLKQFAGDTGPLGDRTTAPDAYWVDMRDLLLYGDQFQNVNAFNVVPATVGADHMVPLPTGDTFNSKKVTEAMVKEFFTDNSKFMVRQDGYVSLSVKGVQTDHTVGNFAQM